MSGKELTGCGVTFTDTLRIVHFRDENVVAFFKDKKVIEAMSTEDFVNNIRRMIEVLSWDAQSAIVKAWAEAEHELDFDLM